MIAIMRENLSNYLNLLSVARVSTVVPPPKECPITTAFSVSK